MGYGVPAGWPVLVQILPLAGLCSLPDPFHWVGPGALASLAVLPLLLLQLVAGLLFLGLQRRLRGRPRGAVPSQQEV